jgi:hypothetical protein
VATLLLYVGASVVLGVLAVFLGMEMVKAS